MKRYSLFSAIVLAAAVSSAYAAEPPEVPDPLTLRAAIDYALAHYPAIRAKMAEIAAADAGVSLARTASFPKVDGLFALNRATRNNVFGALFPQSVIPSISGPVLGATPDSAFGSAAGLLVGWEPFDFGPRKANVGVSEAKRGEAATQLELTRYQVALSVADAFLSSAANQQAARAAEANVSRLEVVVNSVHVLVENQLRPGADESRIQVELALARAQSIRAGQHAAENLATLAETLGAAGATIHIDAGNLLNAPPPKAPVTAEALGDHPALLARMSVIHTTEARQKALDKSYVPRLTLQGALWSRGTGSLTDGSILGGANGLAPTTSNGALGLSLTFPLSDFASLGRKKTIERETLEAEKAGYDETVQQLKGDLARARTEREAAERIAANIPSEMSAAHAIDAQSQARYQAGLGTIIEVADAQRLLTQAEIDDAIARLAVWRARLSEAAAAGDIQAAFK